MFKYARHMMAVSIIPLIVVVGCTSTTQEGSTGISRKQLMLLSSSQVDALALESYQGELSTAKGKGVLNTDKANLERIRKIADRLIPQVNAFRPDARAWAWEVNLETNNQLNAYCAPGGKIMFYTGIINQLKLTDDEIAAIMGHEMAHALREHGRERMSQAYAQQAGLGIAGALLGATQGQMSLANTAAQLAISLPHNRGQESEADILGLELAARAGFDPRASVTLWQKMAQASGGGGSPSFLSTHPSSGQRIKELQAAIPKVDPLFKQAKANWKSSVPAAVPRT